MKTGSCGPSSDAGSVHQEVQTKRQIGVIDRGDRSGWRSVKVVRDSNCATARSERLRTKGLAGNEPESETR